MIVTFAVENWRCFKGRTVLSARASRERLNGGTLAILPPRYGNAKILPVLAIFGANASGKTSLFDALLFLQRLVVDGTRVGQPMGIDPFELDAECKRSPSNFVLEVLIDNLIYRYEVSISQTAVDRERLSILRTRNEQLLFDRMRDTFEFGAKLKSERLDLIAENTRSNQLFLHNAVNQNAIELNPLYEWFSSSLNVIGTDSTFEGHSRMLLRSDYKQFVNECLKRYGTGAEEISLVTIDPNTIPITSDVMDQLQALAIERSGEELSAQLRVSSGSQYGIYILRIKEEGISAFKVTLIHRGNRGEEIPFELSRESKGTRRLLELLPMFFDFASIPINGEGFGRSHGREQVYVVDELDMSFHSALTAKLIEDCIACCSADTRIQLIFSTQDLVILDSDVLRHDEIWFCERDGEDTSTLSCLGNHPGIRGDSDVLKNYLAQAYGGYPKFA